MKTAASELRLRAGALELILVPERGGGIARFDFVRGADQRIPIFRPLDGEDPRPVALASFPLVPFVNRVRGGRFRFRGREVALKANMPPDPSPLHGQGWLAAWAAASASERGAELVYLHEAGEWPWAYEARQRFALDEAGLDLELDCTNRSNEPMPCGLGQHPFLPCTATTRLDTVVDTVWTIDDKVLPVEQVPATGRYDLRDRPVCGQGLDHGFGGWGGRARIADPALPFAIEMSSPDARFFQLYSPADGGLFVVEPVTHANAAMNAPEAEWDELGLRILGPGETMRMRTRIDIVQ